MKILNDEVFIKLMDKINNPFKTPSSNYTRVTDESLSVLSNSCLSLTKMVSIEQRIRKTRMANNRTIRSGGSIFQFVPSSSREPMVKIMRSIDEISIYSIIDCNIFHWLSDEDVVPLIDMEEMDYTEGLHYKCYNRSVPLSTMDAVFY